MVEKCFQFNGDKKNGDINKIGYQDKIYQAARKLFKNFNRESEKIKKDKRNNKIVKDYQEEIGGKLIM